MSFLVLIGRIAYAYIFVTAGYGHLKNLDQTAAMAAKIKAPFPKFSAFLMSLLAIIGGLSIAFGFYAQVGSLFIIIFLFLTMFMVHGYWGLPDKAQATLQKIQFNKNLSMLGAALIILYYGSGPFSIL